MATESFPVTAHTKVIIPGATRAPESSGARSRTRKLLAGAAVAVLAAAALVLGLTWGHDDPTKSPDPTTTSTSRAASASSAPTSSTTSSTPPTTSSTSSAGAGQVTVPNVVGMVAGSAQAVLGSFGLGAQLPPGGTGATVTGQTPAAGTSVATGTTVALH